MKPRILPIVTVIFSLVFLAGDFIYKTVNNISRLTRDRCLLYRNLPEPVFLFFENFVELFFMIVAGLFVGVMAEKLFLKTGRFVPKNPLQAFAIGSLLPVCSCGAVPLAASFREKPNIRTLVTFLVAAPLLNPSVMVLSWTILGPRFALAKIAGSLVLSVSSGYLLELFTGKFPLPSSGPFICDKYRNGGDPFTRTWFMLKKVFPWYLLAAVSGMLPCFMPVDRLLDRLGPLPTFPGLLLAVLAGIPVYLCNGADILLLKPFAEQANLSLGMGLAFSMTSTAVCLSSLVLMANFLGRKLTAVLTGNIFVVTLGWGLAFSGTGF